MAKNVNIRNRSSRIAIGHTVVGDVGDCIPFLNGGLFENLDEFPSEENDLKSEVRIDGFSDVPSKQPLVPDFLFFGDERRVPEIAELLGEATAPKARGLLNIFRDYKFTIEENTPLEQDIALMYVLCLISK
jgi:adenine-specific DNA-methyltransferase